MRPAACLAGLALSASLTSAAWAQMLPGSEARMQDGLPYRLWTPPAYDKAMKYPLVVYLHGAGERGNNDTSHISASYQMLAPFVNTTWQAQNPAFVIAPQCPANAQWVDWPWAKGSYDLTKVPESAQLKTVRAIVAALRTEFSIDADRLYVVGLSMGGFGTWDMIMRTPDMFAGAVASDGGASPTSAALLKRMAIWSHHDADDGTVPVSGDREMYAALAAAGAFPTYTEYASGGHGAWIKVGANPAYPTWVFAQRRGVPPTPVPQLAFMPTGAAPTPTPPAITMTSSLTGAMIRYSLGPTVPTAATGMPYAQPVMLTAGGIVQGLAISGTGNAQISVLHSAMFVVGSAADGGVPPADAGRVADAAPGAADSRITSAEDAAARPTDAATTTGPTRADAAAPAQSGGGDPDAGATPRKKAMSGGCSLAARGRPRGAALLALVALAAALRSRRRLRLAHPRQHGVEDVQLDPLEVAR